MKKTIKAIMVMMILLAICLTSTSVLAAGNLIPTPDTNGTASGEISRIGGQIAGIVQVAGMSIAVIILIYIGIRYIIGSAEQQAEYKKSMIPYIIGAIILFLASFLVRVIFDFSQTIGTP